MLYTIEIYKTDKRTKEGQRLIGKYDYDRKDRASMEREVKELRQANEILRLASAFFAQAELDRLKKK